MFLISLLSVHTDINRGHLFRFSTYLVDVGKSKRCRTHTASSTTISSHPPLLLPLIWLMNSEHRYTHWQVASCIYFMIEPPIHPCVVQDDWNYGWNRHWISSEGRAGPITTFVSLKFRYHLTPRLRQMVRQTHEHS